MDKTTFLPRLQRERDKFEALLNQAGFARQMTMKGVAGNLSIKDLLADVLAREQFMADRLSEILHGESYLPCASHSALHAFEKKFGYPDYESPLAEKEKPQHLFVYRHKNVGLDDLVEQELAAYASVVRALEKLTPGQCFEYDVFRRVAEQTYKAYRRAMQQIIRWRASISAG